VIDSTQLLAHKADGTTTFKLDVTTGAITMITSTAANGAISFVSTAGVEQARIVVDGTILAGGLTLDSIQNIQLIAEAAIGGASTTMSNLTLFVGAGSATLQGIAPNHTAGVAITSLNPARIGLQTNDAGTIDTIDVVNGKAVFANNRFPGHNAGGQVNTVGFRGKAVAAADIWGSDLMYRLVRCDGNGGTVTPGSLTLGGAPIINTNVTSLVFASIRADAAMCRITATAIGVFEYFNTVTIN
jgi:hypothetical protein